jgi:hypothetical protein
MIAFDTFGWELSRNRLRIREWRHDDTTLALRFFERPPDFGSWEADHIRQQLLETFALLESPSVTIEELELPDWFGRNRPTVSPELINLLEVACFEIPPARCVLAMTRHRLHGAVHYSTGIFLLFGDCFWLLQLDVEERAGVGAREGAVAHRILGRNAAAATPLDLFDPYDRQWDGIVAIEEDPLTRLRLLVTRLRDSISLHERLDGLQPFAPGD